MNLLETCVQKIDKNSHALVYTFSNWTKTALCPEGQICGSNGAYHRNMSLNLINISENFQNLILPKQDFWSFIKIIINKEYFNHIVTDQDNIQKYLLEHSCTFTKTFNRVAHQTRRGVANHFVANYKLKDIVDHFCINMPHIKFLGYTNEIEGVLGFYRKSYDHPNTYDGGMFYEELDNDMVKLYYNTDSNKHLVNGIDYFNYIDVNRVEPYAASAMLSKELRNNSLAIQLNNAKV